MKRDLDLARQLLLDIETRGADCSVSVLRTAPNTENQDRIRYHLTLLVDAGYLKELDRTSQGVPCVRLTDAGHELIELSRSESRWRDAKAVCQQTSGGLSLAVIRNLLWQWAVQTPRLRPRSRVEFAAPALADGRYRGRRAPYRFDPYFEDAWDYAEDEVQYVRVRPAARDGWQLSSLDADAIPMAAEVDRGAVLPQHLI
jgi:hypothetical protein